MRQALARLLFLEEELQARQARGDPVLLAKPTQKVQTKKNRCRHQCRFRADADGPTVERPTEPTPLQQRALELVRAFPGNDKFNS